MLTCRTTSSVAIDSMTSLTWLDLSFNNITELGSDGKSAISSLSGLR